jgi:hypothetical protein
MTDERIGAWAYGCTCGKDITLQFVMDDSSPNVVTNIAHRGSRYRYMFDPAVTTEWAATAILHSVGTVLTNTPGCEMRTWRPVRLEEHQW